MRKCKVLRCKNYEIVVQYYNNPVCARHWKDHCEDNINLKKEFGIEQEPEPISGV